MDDIHNTLSINHISNFDQSGGKSRNEEGSTQFTDYMN